MAAKNKSLDEQLSLSTQQLEQRRSMNDNLSAAREVEHFASFSRRKQAERASQALLSEGFQVVTAKQGLRTTLTASRSEDVSAARVEATVRSVYAAVTNAGGEYDGWGGPVM